MAKKKGKKRQQEIALKGKPRTRLPMDWWERSKNKTKKKGRDKNGKKKFVCTVLRLPKKKRGGDRKHLELRKDRN